ncbi:MAG: PBECR2 nuclease fold domain-containing protein [Nitrospinota bacterium]
MSFPRIIESVLKTRVHLTKERWEHIINEHPVVKSYLKEIEETISFPDVIMKSKYDKEILLYYRFYENIFGGKFIIVVVKHTEERNFVLTAYITDKVKGGVHVWKKN